jgi:hypothetical protein
MNKSYKNIAIHFLKDRKDFFASFCLCIFCTHHDLFNQTITHKTCTSFLTVIRQEHYYPKNIQLFILISRPKCYLLKVAIHQPQYFPYAGFFHKLSLADVFVIMDDVQYDKRFTNRNRIVSPNGWIWITVPINKDHKFSPNHAVEVNNDLDWKETHRKKIFHSYSKARFFHIYKDYFESLYDKDWNMLFELNLETINQVIKWLGIKIDIIKESELNVSGESTQRLVNVCKALGADTYVSGSGGIGYLDEKAFEKNSIRLEYQKYRCRPYLQHLSEQFIPNLSIIDMLANVGPSSSQLISESAELVAST